MNMLRNPPFFIQISSDWLSWQSQSSFTKACAVEVASRKAAANVLVNLVVSIRIFVSIVEWPKERVVGIGGSLVEQHCYLIAGSQTPEKS